MNTSPRLPRELMPTGYNVAVVGLPLAAGSVAHRPQSMTRPVKGRRGLRDEKETVYLPACVKAGPKAATAAQFSAAWADHLGAVACTEPACFPDATR